MKQCFLMRPIISKVFSILWPLAILALPWQTRWILHQGTLAGFPWEEGTICIYVSWTVLLAASACGFFLAGKDRVREMLRGKEMRMIGIAAAVLFLPTIMTSSWSASMMWWLQIIILTLFIASLLASLPSVASAEGGRLSFLSVASWFVISMLPEAILGIFQFVNQDVLGSKWVGMATQHPWIAGTSVVQHGLYRVLRIYGSFPHPNILGGWLAMALTVIPLLIPAIRRTLRPLLYVAAAIFAYALVFTFSKSAWLAAAIGAMISCIEAFVHTDEWEKKIAVILFIIAAAGAGGLCMVTQWDHVDTRLQAQESLEQLSTVTRAQAIREGFDAWKQRPYFGWGANAGLVGISAIRKIHPFAIPIAPEPPHAAPLVALLDVGILGFIGAAILIFYLIVASIRKTTFRFRKKSITIPHPDPVIFTLIVLACIDHYLWTTWSGQSLMAMAVGLVVLGSGKSQSSESTFPRPLPSQEGELSKKVDEA
jgi:O-antigen ligase